MYVYCLAHEEIRNLKRLEGFNNKSIIERSRSSDYNFLNGLLSGI